MSITEQSTTLPTGTYAADRVHSSVAFRGRVHGDRRVRRHRQRLRRHARGRAPFRLRPASRASRRRTRTSTRHLMSPEFFDAERHPGSSPSRPSSAPVDGSSVELRGRDHDQGHHPARHADRHDRRPDDRPVRQRALRPEARDHDRPHRVRDQLERRHAERHEGPFRRGHPQGRPLAGEGGVTMRILAISGSLRARLAEHLPPAGRRGAALAARHVRALGRAARGAAVRPGRRRRARPSRRGSAPRRGRVGGRRPDRDARVQLVDPRVRSRTRSTGPRARSRRTCSATSRSP